MQFKGRRSRKEKQRYDGKKQAQGSIFHVLALLEEQFPTMSMFWCYDVVL